MFFTLLLLFITIFVLTCILTYEWWKGKHFITKQQLHKAHKNIRHLIELEKFNEAYKISQNLFFKGQRDVNTIYYHVQCLRKIESFYEAIHLIQDQSNTNQKDYRLLHEEAKIYLAQKNYKKAAKIFQSCENSLRREGDLLDYGRCLIALKQFTKAWEKLHPLLKQTQKGETFALCGDCRFQMKDFKGAYFLFKRTLEVGYRQQQVISKIGHCLRHLKEHKKAKHFFEKIIRVDSSDISATLGLGACLESEKCYEEAFNLYKNSKSWKKKDCRILRQAGICALKLNKYRLGEIYLKKSIEIGSSSLQSLIFLAYSLDFQQKWTESEQIYLTLIKKHKSNVAGYRGLAWLYGVGLSTTINAEQGILMARKSLELLPDATSWEILSACEARKGNFNEAHQIQECLSSQSLDKSTRNRRLNAMRSLRKQIPLNETQVANSLVA